MVTYNIELEPNNLICEAAGCFARAASRIEVKAGPQQVISLLVCIDCISRFEEDTQP